MDKKTESLSDLIIKKLDDIYDPEIPVSIYELGLIYDVRINKNGDVKIIMTLTSPSCPVAESLPEEVKTEVEKIKGVRSVGVDITFEPPWEKSMMSEEAKLELGFL